MTEEEKSETVKKTWHVNLRYVIFEKPDYNSMFAAFT